MSFFITKEIWNIKRSFFVKSYKVMRDGENHIFGTDIAKQYAVIFGM